MAVVLPEVAGSSVELDLGDRVVLVKPLTWESIAQEMELMIQRRLSILPKYSEVLSTLVNSPADSIESALRTLGDMHRKATEPDISEFMNEVVNNQRVLMRILATCVEDSFKPVTETDIFHAITKDERFLNRWFVQSGLGSSFTKNPT